MKTKTPTTISVTAEEFAALAKANPHIRVRRFQASGSEEHHYVSRRADGTIYDLVHDFRAMF
jgi:hypothetical protein